MLINTYKNDVIGSLSMSNIEYFIENFENDVHDPYLLCF